MCMSKNTTQRNDGLLFLFIFLFQFLFRPDREGVQMAAVARDPPRTKKRVKVSEVNRSDCPSVCMSVCLSVCLSV